MKYLFICLLGLFSLFLLPNSALAANQPFPAKVVNVTDSQGDEENSQNQWLELKNAQTNENFFIKNEQIPQFKYTKYQIGEKLLVELSDNEKQYFIVDYYRQGTLNFLFWLFVITVLIVGKLYGLTSLFGMGLSLLVIIKVILPQISNGTNPILVVLIASIFLISTTFYLSHGINTKTNLAILGTFISAAITATLAFVFTHFSHLTGFASEEASFLDQAKNGAINIQSLLISGIIIGSIGILDDVSVSQVSVVKELASANPKFTFFQLFARSMSVGRDHVASMVNTLFLVYTGAALPLMLLFMDNSVTINQILNTEMVAEEIVRTLVASIGLILAVPTTTFMASRYYSGSKD